MNSSEFLKLSQEWSRLQEEKDRLEALICHLEGEGGITYDFAPQRGLYIEKSPCPPEFIEYQQKNSAEILKDFKISLRNIENNLQKVESELKKFVQK